MLREYVPCLPSRAAVAPSGDGWVHEIKHDGYRLIAHRRADRVRLFTKNGNDWSKRYPRISAALLNLRVQSVVLDGEVATLDSRGSADFDGLHSRANDGIALMLAFDVLEVDGEDLRKLPLLDRKKRLSALLRKPVDGLQYVEHLTGDGPTIFEHVCRLGLEGIVSKRADSIYKGGPSRTWIKTKNRSHPALLRVAEAKRN